jgi:heme-degrading monooxygenase HmoA
MILERALMTVTDPAGFERAFAEARQVLAKASGFRFVDLLQGIEHPDTYLLLIGWDSVEDHMVGFRESELFAEWRALLGPYFAAAPDVEHFDPRGARFIG